MNPRHLERVAMVVVEQTMRGLPEKIRSAAEGCIIEVAQMSELVNDDPALDTDLLGLFEGYSINDDEAASVASDLPRIRLFLDNLWDYAGRDRAAFREEVRITLLHELGHYLGLDEDQVAQMGLA